MALSSSSRRVFRLLAVAGALGARLCRRDVRVHPGPRAGVRLLLTSRPAPAYGYGPRPYYYQEAPQAFQLGFDLEGVVPLNPPSVNGGPAAIGGGAAASKSASGEQFASRASASRRRSATAYDHLWAADNFDNSYGWSMNRVFAGARLGFGRRSCRPSTPISATAGARRDADCISTGQNGGLAFDVGGALDFRVAPHFGFGAHLEYSRRSRLSTDTPQWIALGGHANFLF